ncbi:lipocalin family protein [Cedratvirus kamchatka]|uniref:Lipocalin family protein n=1 Tax=Cedratvirus kamchatka TaxID=2716914 RepID=A0A6G8MZ01_9VIRU|nr:lipocalin family protein [Cedratvirus kamchatka]WIL04960.1 lipocalin-like/cytosolic fatty-acid binding protein [Cedratvirus duvanny]
MFSPSEYQGSWFEIAKYPVFYEQFGPSCAYSVADYRYNRGGDGTPGYINVLNTCYNESGEAVNSILGIAKPKNKMGQFSLRFFPESFAPYPTNPGDASYNVLWTDYDNFSFVSDDNKTSFYVLSRKRDLTAQDYAFIKQKTVELGFNPSRLQYNFGQPPETPGVIGVR